MKEKYIDYFFDVAERTSQLSYATRLKVGTVIVKNDRIISCGYNNLPAGWLPNDCERIITISDEEYQKLPPSEQSRFDQKYRKFDIFEDGYAYFDGMKLEWFGLKTLDEVIHSEANAISQLASSTESGIGASLFCTHSPCLQCSKIIYGSGIKTVYYKNDYRDSSGIEFLKRCGVEVIKYVER